LLGVNEDAGPSLTTTTTTTTIGTTTTTTAATGAEAAVDDVVVCNPEADNHGEAVSEVAKNTDTVGAEHGAAVSAMAQSDCGKTEDEEVIAPESEPADDVVVCNPEADNHGEAVSEVAKNKDTVGAEHGAAVSAMAQSDCGKTEGTDSAEDENEERAAHEPAGKSAKNNAHHNDDDGDELGS
jgi:hypothetical protein